MLSTLRHRLRLSRAGLLVLAVTVAAVGVAGVVLAKVSEDVVRTNGLALHDPANLTFFTEHRTASLVGLARLFTDVGGVVVIVPLALVAAVWLWFRGAALVVALAPALSLGLAGALAGAGKALVGRSRPPAVFHLVPETDASFPSGHATDSAALYLAIGIVAAVVVFRHPLARVLSVAATGLLAAMVAASRLVLGVHWPTDVLAGMALGGAVALTVSTGAILISRLEPVEPRDRAGSAARLWGRAWALLDWHRPQADALRVT
jgi:membrane-associated phospholipid phosphatase